MPNFRIFPGWFVVIGAGAGIAFGSVVFLGTGFALIAGAMAQSFGWNQVEVVQAATIFLAMITLSWPINGWLLDRYGARSIAMGSIFLFACGLMGLSLVGNLSEFYFAFGLIGLISGSTNAISYARAISLWFDRRRGLALGLATSLQGVGAAILPLVLAWAIAWDGWQTGLRMLAIVQLLFCLPLVAWLVRDDPKQVGLMPDGGMQATGVEAQNLPDVSGMQIGEVVKSLLFWQLAICFLLGGATFYAISTNLAYIVRTATDGDPVRMSRLLAIGGFAVVFGRFIFGYLLDVMNPALVAVTLFSMCMVFLALDAWGQNYEMLLIAAFISGLVGGGESDLMPYLAGRAFGQRSLSKVLGLFFLAFFMGAAIGPISFAQASQAFGGTTTPLLFLCAMQLVPITIFVRLASRHEFRPDRLKYI